jgi:hypothetical protein
MRCPGPCLLPWRGGQRKGRQGKAALRGKSRIGSESGERRREKRRLGSGNGEQVILDNVYV